MEMILIKIGSPEWEYMWDWIEAHPINEGLDKPSIAYHEGEMWQYKGSFKQGERTIHSFSHKCHPRHGQPVHLHVQASDNFVENDIQKEIKLK